MIKVRIKVTGEFMTSFTKQRDVMFSPLHDDENQASTASKMLNDLEGIVLASVISETHL